MKKLPDESYEHWVKRVEQYEFGRGLMRLANGQDPKQVLEEVGYRMMKKLQHPMIEAVSNLISADYDQEGSLSQYQKNYLDRFDPKPDHIKD